MDIQPLIDAIRIDPDQNQTMIPAGVKLVPACMHSNAPANMMGELQAENLETLTAYAIGYSKHRTAAVFASREHLAVEAILDWHNIGDNIAGWGDHSISYSLSLTPEFKAWSAINGRLLNQNLFAEFIEEHLDDIYAPAAADILTVATTLSGKRKVEFTNVVTLGNGDKSLQWSESTEAKAAGDIRVPSEITIRIPIFVGCEAATTFDIRALFRYRIADGRLGFEIRLMHVEKIQNLAFDQVVKNLNELLKDSSVPVHMGRIETLPRKILEHQIVKA